MVDAVAAVITFGFTSAFEGAGVEAVSCLVKKCEV